MKRKVVHSSISIKAEVFTIDLIEGGKALAFLLHLDESSAGMGV